MRWHGVAVAGVVVAVAVGFMLALPDGAAAASAPVPAWGSGWVTFMQTGTVPTPVPVIDMSDHVIAGTNDVVEVLQEGLGPVIAGALGIFALIKGLNYVRGLL